MPATESPLAERGIHVQDIIEQAVRQIGRVLLGKDRQIRLALCALFSRGHLLIEDMPGMGKTTLSHALARVLGLEFARVQFTSDMLPGDILGVSVYDQRAQAFNFHPGPVFTEVLLAQMKALEGDAALCRNLLLGDPAAHRRLPRELAWREAEWLLGALGESPRGTPARRPNSLELEVIRRTLGLRAPQHLASLWRPTTMPPEGEPDCERGRAMLAELGTLAAPQRRLALRLMYERE